MDDTFRAVELRLRHGNPDELEKLLLAAARGAKEDEFGEHWQEYRRAHKLPEEYNITQYRKFPQIHQKLLRHYGTLVGQLITLRRAPQKITQNIRRAIVHRLRDHTHLEELADKYTTLRALGFRHSRIRPDSARKIGTMYGLHELSVRNASIGDSSAREIAKLQNLQTLDISDNTLLGDDGAKEIGTMQGLQTLYISCTALGYDSAREIANLHGLRKLNIYRNYIGALGAREIAKLTGLDTLDIGCNQLGVSGAREIAKLTGLRTLYIALNGLSPRDIEELKTALPNTQVVAE